MSFYDFMHKFFQDFHGGNIRPPDPDGSFGLQKPVDPFRDSEDTRNNGRMFSSTFDIITDPFEMQQLFEKQFNDVLKSFSTNMEGFFGFQGADMFDLPNRPAIEGSSDPREHYLKPGVIQEHFNKNFDNRVEMPSWLDSLLPTPSTEDKGTQPRVFSSFSSVVKKTVRLPDGTVKTEEIIRKPDGTEERTESETAPDENNPHLFDSPFINPGISGFFKFPKLGLPEPKPRENDPREQFLKPGYEKLNPHGGKVDRDLDSQVQQSGLDSLPLFPKEPQVEAPNHQFSFKSVTRKTVKLPNGVIETEEIIRNSDGTEQRTVSQTLPDGTSTTAAPDSLLKGSSSVLEPGREQAVARSFAFIGIKDLMDKLFK